MSLAQALISYARTDGREGVSPVLEALKQSRMRRSQPDDGEGGGGAGSRHPYPTGPDYPVKLSGKSLILPTSWKGTHTTSGLGWSAGTAEDIMAQAGTIVGAPEAGSVVYWHPEGAQGGGSMLFDPEAPGPNYWLGHLDAGVPGGTRVRRGGRIALVSSRHAAPHVHIDRDY